jgi:16S rRNA (guanine527-N7)-methyltransferase
VFHVKTFYAPSGPVLRELNSLCTRFGLSPSQQEQLGGVLGYLATDDLAPTTVRTPEQALRTHLADSLVALDLEVVRAAAAIADLGAGAGFPGLPLAVALPAGEVRSIESQGRKCAFIEGMCRATGIDNVRAVRSRAEEWVDGVAANDLVLARALAAPSVVLEYAAPLLRLGGSLVDWRGRRSPLEEEAALRAAAELGMELSEVRRMEPYVGAREHHLHVYLKVASTPPRFPRRPGVARKRPLGC